MYSYLVALINKHKVLFFWFIASFIPLVLLNRGEFAVNDDWVFYRQIEAFMSSKYTISALIDPSFILQGILGKIWASLFGLSFVSLRFLTIILFELSVLGMYKILKLFKASSKTTFFALGIFSFNPLVFTSALSFMTEIYFLVFMIWSAYFLLKYLDTDHKIDLLSSAMLGAASLLIRQVGIIFFASVLAILIFRIFKDKNPRKFIPEISLLILPLLISLAVFYLWPRYHEEINATGLGRLLTGINVDNMILKAKLLAYSLAYFGFFFLPIMLPHIIVISSQRREIHLIHVLLLSIILGIHLYSVDIFLLGSVFYLEGFHIKSGYSHDLSIFDNIPFKVFSAFLVSTGSILFLIKMFSEIKSAKNDRKLQFLTLTILGSLLILLLGNDFYDRYLIPTIALAIPLLAHNLEIPAGLKSFLAYATLSIMIVVTLFLQTDYMLSAKEKWKQAVKLQSVTGLIAGISVDDVYAKYFNAKKLNDYTGLVATMPPNSDHKCYVQQYTTEDANQILNFIKRVDEESDKFLDNPRVFEARKKQGTPKIKKHLQELIYNSEYFSPLYNIVGKKAYVGSWCDKDL